MDELSPTREQISSFIIKVEKQQRKTHLVQATHHYMANGASVYPRSWHCNNYKDNWVVVDNEGHLMACEERPTTIPVLDVQSLADKRWVRERTAVREACSGCSYQCYIDEENLDRVGLVRDCLARGIGLLQASTHSNSHLREEKQSLKYSKVQDKAKTLN